MIDKVCFDDYAGEYNDINDHIGTFFSKDSSYFQEYKIKILAHNINFFPKSILEYGCGVGRNIEFLLKYFNTAEIWGCDISQKSIEIAKKSYPSVDFFLCDEIPKKKFDLIFISNVYHHVPLKERDSVTKKIYSILNDTGTVFIFEHNPYNPITKRIVDKCPYDKDAILLTRKELSTILKNNGFLIETKKFTLFFPKILRIFWGLEKYIGFIPFGGQYFLKAIKSQNIT